MAPEIESDDATRRLQRERNVWRGIAIGLAAMLALLMGIGSVVGLTLLVQGRQQAVRAEIAAVEAAQQRLQAQQAAEAEREAVLRLRKRDEPITRPQAIKIAEDHLGAKGQRKADAAPQEDGGWRVTIRRLPEVPGGFTTVVVDKQGKVVRVEPGK